MKIERKLISATSALVAILLFLLVPFSVNAEEKEFVINKVTVGTQEAEVATASDKDETVFTASFSGHVSDGYTIDLTVPDDATVAAVDFEGSALDVTVSDGNAVITKPESTVEMYGSYVCYITVTKDGVDTEYKLILNGSNTWEVISETSIADSTSGELNYFGDEYAILRDATATGKAYRSLTVDSDVKDVTIVRWSQIDRTESYLPTGMRWLSNGNNYIRINSSKVSDFKQFNASTSYQDTFLSPSLSLERGLNIIEVYYKDEKIAAMDQASGGLPEGLSSYKVSSYASAVYLVYTDGENVEKKKSSDTSLQYVDATQLGSTNVAMTEYLATKNDGEWILALPETLPLDKIILGVVTSDPMATWEIADSTLQKGEQFGMYVAVTVGDTLESIPVKVTAEDGTEETYQITISRKKGESELKSISLDNAVLKLYETKEETTLSSDITTYLLQLTEDDAKLSIGNISDGATCLINGESKTNIELSLEDYYAIVEITAEDRVHSTKYYFIYQDKEGNIPMLGSVTEEEKTEATSMLTDWYNRSDDVKNDISANSAWGLYMKVATNEDLTGTNVDKISEDESGYSQATVWSRTILELIMLGYNPYDYGENHFNLVEGLQSLKSEAGLYGGYGNNVWALMALKACGEEIPDGLITYVKTVDMYNTYSVDIRGWAIAALKGLIPDSELIEGVIALKEAQEEDGLWGNNYTNGAVLSGIVGAGISLDYFSVDGKSLLDIYEESSSITGDQFGFCKDMIIGLGDVINGSNIWQRYILDEEKWTKLINKAEELAEANTDNTELAECLAAAKEKKEQEGEGKVYFALYDEVAALDSSWRASVTFGKSADLIEVTEDQDYVIKTYPTTTGTNKITLVNGWLRQYSVYCAINGKYNGMDSDSQLAKGCRICEVPGLDIDYTEYTLEKMISLQKEAGYYTGYNSGRNVWIIKTEAYKKKMYFVMYIPATTAQAPDTSEMLNKWNETYANSTVIEVGPVKVDLNAPELKIGASSSDLQSGDTVMISDANDIEKLVIDSSDTMSGVYQVQYQADEEEWVTVYDAATDDGIDVENDCGKNEVTSEVPIAGVSSLNVKVTDIAGRTTTSAVSVVRNPEFQSTPVTVFDSNNITDAVWNITLNGTALSSVSEGENALVSGTDYEMDNETGKLTLKASYLSGLTAGEHPLTLTFTRDGEEIDAKLSATIIMGDQSTLIKKLEDKVNSIGEVTLDKEKAVEEAKVYYDSLSDSLKNAVSADVKTTLESAVSKIQELKKEKADKEEAASVEKQIASIGEVDRTKEAVIEKANLAYEALTEDQKKYVSNYDVLQAALESIKKIVSDDAAAVENVKTLIAAIGDIDLTKEDAIKSARAAYDALDESLKEQITDDEMDTLLAAEVTFAGLKNTNDKQEGAKVIEMINSLGEIDLSKQNAVSEARKAYEALTEDQKKLVSAEYLDILEQAEKKIAELSKPASTTETPKETGKSSETAVLKKGQEVVWGTAVYTVVDETLASPKVIYKKNNQKKAKKVTVPAAIQVNGVSCQVIGIGKKAFANNKKLKKVVINAEIQTIEKKAFVGCKNLRKIVIKSAQLKSVGAKAFKNVNARVKISVPAKMLKKYKKLLKNKGLEKSAIIR